MFAVLRIALRALRRNILRSFLTMLGIIVGIASVIVGVSMGTGAKADVDKRIASMGQNLLVVMSGNMSRGGARGGFGATPNISPGDYEALRREVAGVVGASPEVRANAQIAAGNQNTFVQVSGVSADYAEVRSWEFKGGGNFSDADVRNANKVCLIGATTAKTLFGENIDPVGQIVRIKNAPISIVGWLSPKGVNSFGQDQDDIVLMPYTSVMKRLSGDTMFRSLNIQVEGPNVISDVQTNIYELLRQRHKIQPGRDDDFMVRNQQEMSDFFNANNRVMTILIGFFAGISLVVGGIGIMNIMLVSVTERTREIGIRLAVGARGRDVLLQFLTEAVLLSAAGGALGIGTGYWLAPLLTKYFEFPTLISNSSVIMAFTVSAIIGIVFGFFPALKAARLDPIDALRFE